MDAPKELDGKFSWKGIKAAFNDLLGFGKSITPIQGAYVVISDRPNGKEIAVDTAALSGAVGGAIAVGTAPLAGGPGAVDPCTELNFDEELFQVNDDGGGEAIVTLSTSGMLRVTTEDASGYAAGSGVSSVLGINVLTFDQDNFEIYDGGGGQCVVKLKTCDATCP
jgi:hypothetical protein